MTALALNFPALSWPSLGTMLKDGGPSSGVRFDPPEPTATGADAFDDTEAVLPDEALAPEDDQADDTEDFHEF